MASAWSSGRSVVEKPTTSGAAEACGADMVEKPTTFGAAEACGADMVEKPITFGAAEVCEADMVEKPITMGIPQAFCSLRKGVCGKPNTMRSVRLLPPILDYPAPYLYNYRNGLYQG
ncbi:hypothetical protein [Paenibacillus silagei]|uniref:hypothetical protein n=1 Tax=Paenibacillus silagei TaxID=1670801 RepID=UPI001AE745D2|nr:hypothetical protein [Paenibacillus silagei]